MRVEVNSYILNRFGTDFVGTSGDEVIYICPYCEDNVGSPDTHGHLYVNNRSLLYYCQRCGAKGRVGSVGAVYEYDPVPSDSEMMGLLESVVGGDYATGGGEPRFRIPPELVDPDSQCGRYLAGRGITQDIVRHYSIRQGDGNRVQRAFIPNQIFEGEDCEETDIYVARYCGDIPLNSNGKAAFPKYLNPYGANKSHIVFNLHRVPRGEPLIICEGVLSAISAGRNSVAIFGKSISDVQLSMILSNEPDRIYVCLDPDARREALALCHRLCRTVTVPVYDIEMPAGHDPNSVGHAEFTRILASTRRFDPVERQLLSMAT